VSEIGLSELKAFPYPLLIVEKMTEGQIIQPEEIKNVNGDIKLGKFPDCETLIRIDEKNNEVWGKCTCLQYDEGRPCVHIASMFFHLRQNDGGDKEDEPGVVEKIIKGELPDISKSAIVTKVEPAKDTPEEGKKRAMDFVRNAQSQATELQIIKKIDDLDEQIAIKEYVAGSVPLVYEIPSRNGKKFELSIRGWVQAMLYQGNVEIEDVKFEEIGGKVVAKAFVVDKAHNVKVVGIAERVSNQDFFYTTLASKAIRNALKKIISPAFEQRVIKEAIESKLVLTLRDLREVAPP